MCDMEDSFTHLSPFWYDQAFIDEPVPLHLCDVSHSGGGRFKFLGEGVGGIACFDFVKECIFYALTSMCVWHAPWFC